ncbi:ThiF family adenylyltransferase [Ferrigenium sp. UT5]|uniref:tRNA threonylcarbamoyladenosine dehydratase n=1 Tax=Ferrigenium sp. UT5 TaxID=3242105 RepID=UPI003550B0DF
MHNRPLDDDHPRRFGGIDRLYGEGARLALHRARVAVIGVGGVGSWAVEALARSGVGNLTLIDFDHIAVSNVNRQVQALDSTLGMAKIDALQARIRDINPDCRVTPVDDFLATDNLARLIAPGAFDAVIDACDEAKVKAALIVHARFNKIPLVVCGAAGGKADPLQMRRDDLGRVTHDALLARIRTLLKKDFNILPRKNGKFGVTCVYLEEPSQRSASCATADLNCSGYGSAVTVTASMGFAAAGWCIDRLLQKP